MVASAEVGGWTMEKWVGYWQSRIYSKGFKEVIVRPDEHQADRVAPSPAYAAHPCGFIKWQTLLLRHEIRSPQTQTTYEQSTHMP